jgi:cadmium resistance protein CadD (predicted permease)
MEHLVTLIGMAVVLFASTNIDDVFVLLGFFADPKFRVRQVVLGQYIGIAGLYGASVAASLISLVVSPAYVGLLGLAPIAIGLKKVWNLWKRTDDDEEAAAEKKSPAAGRGNVVAVAVVTLANGGDNISIYTPLFAARSGADITVIGIVFAGMTLVWLVVAHGLTNHRTLGAPIRRYGRRVVPFVLIALGVLILFEAGTFELLRR